MFKVSYNGYKGSQPQPQAAMILICFGYFCRGSPGDHFCQIVLKSEHLFKKTFKVSYTGVTGHAPWRPCFLTDQILYC